MAGGASGSGLGATTTAEEVDGAAGSLTAGKVATEAPVRSSLLTMGLTKCEKEDKSVEEKKS